MKALATIFLMTFSIALLGQERLNDVGYVIHDQMIVVYFGSQANQWSVIEVWQDEKMIIDHKPKNSLTGSFAFARGEVDQTKNVTVYVTRMRDKVLFRDHVNVSFKRKANVRLKTK